MTRQHRVDRRRERKLTAQPLPRDTWNGQTFVEANGTELQVVWNGHRDAPPLCGALDQNRQDLPHRLRLTSEPA